MDEDRLYFMSRNAHRLAYVLMCSSTDTNNIPTLARCLCYVPEQLQKDMKDILDYISYLEEEIENLKEK